MGFREHPPKEGDPLTERESDFVTCVAQGLTNPEIAEKWVTVPKTVDFHAHNSRVKMGLLGVSERAFAIACYRRVMED